MGITLELVLLLALSVVGQSVFAVFEVETPWWRKVLKWSLLAGVTLGGFALVGHWILLFPASAAAAGLAVHFGWCRRHGIHPARATPRRRYYELRGWRWPDP